MTLLNQSQADCGKQYTDIREESYKMNVISQLRLFGLGRLILIAVRDIAEISSKTLEEMHVILIWRDN